MAKLIYSAITSLDGYIEDEEGKFDWATPDEEVHAFVNDLERPIGTYLYGRRMYETMVFWETASTAPTSRRSSATSPRSGGRPKGRLLPDAWSVVEREDADRARVRPRRGPPLKESAAADIAVGGAELAGQAIAAGLVDECHLFLYPIVVGGGKRALPDGSAASSSCSTSAGSGAASSMSITG